MTIGQMGQVQEKIDLLGVAIRAYSLERDKEKRRRARDVVYRARNEVFAYVNNLAVQASREEMLKNAD